MWKIGEFDASPLCSSGKICVKEFLTGSGALRRNAKVPPSVLSSFSMSHT